MSRAAAHAHEPSTLSFLKSACLAIVSGVGFPTCCPSATGGPGGKREDIIRTLSKPDVSASPEPPPTGRTRRSEAAKSDVTSATVPGGLTKRRVRPLLSRFPNFQQHPPRPWRQTKSHQVRSDNRWRLRSPRIPRSPSVAGQRYCQAPVQPSSESAGPTRS